MTDSMTLAQLNGGGDHVTGTHGFHSPHVLVAIDQLNSIWNGEFDVVDTIEVLKREAKRLDALADSIESHLL